MPEFKVDVRVRLSETDALGVVYYGQYLTYFDLVRLELLRKVGITLDFLKKKKLGFVAAESNCRYVSSARFDEVLSLSVTVGRIGASSVTYLHEVRQGRRKVAEGKVTDVLVGTDGKAAQIPEDIRTRLSKFSSGSVG